MDRVIRRAIFSSNKKILGYFYFLGKSPFDHDGIYSSVFPILKEIMYGDNLENEKKVLSRLGVKDVEADLFNLLPIDKTVLDISDVVHLDGLQKLLETDYETMLYIETKEDIFNYDVDYYRCGVTNANIQEIVKTIHSLNKKIILCGINDNVLYGKAEQLNPDGYEGIIVAQQMVQSDTKSLFADCVVKKIIKELNSPECDKGRVVDLIMLDSKLLSFLLRGVNSKNLESPKSVRKILMDMDLEYLKNMLNLVSQGTTSDKDAIEFTKSDLMRGIYCKNINKKIQGASFKKIEDDDAYLIGLFSLIDIFNRTSMKDALKNLNPSINMVDALIYKESVGGLMLKLLYAYEDGDNDRVKKYADELGLSMQFIKDNYCSSIMEMQDLWRREFE